jgi:hypothetical protein
MTPMGSDYAGEGGSIGRWCRPRLCLGRWRGRPTLKYHGRVPWSGASSVGVTVTKGRMNNEMGRSWALADGSGQIVK